jgi:hypothetical protein
MVLDHAHETFSILLKLGRTRMEVICLLKLACFLLYFVIRDFHNSTAVYSYFQTDNLHWCILQWTQLTWRGFYFMGITYVFWVNKWVSFWKKKVWTPWLWIFLEVLILFAWWRNYLLLWNQEVYMRADCWTPIWKSSVLVCTCYFQP